MLIPNQLCKNPYQEDLDPVNLEIMQHTMEMTYKISMTAVVHNIMHKKRAKQN